MGQNTALVLRTDGAAPGVHGLPDDVRIITPALISGAVAERMKFSAYMVFIACWSLLVYPALAHVVWGQGGYLAGLGALDFSPGAR